MNIFDKLSDNDKQIIESYILNYSGAERTDLNSVLRFWAENKESLYHALVINLFCLIRLKLRKTKNLSLRNSGMMMI